MDYFSVVFAILSVNYIKFYVKLYSFIRCKQDVKLLLHTKTLEKSRVIFKLVALVRFELTHRAVRAHCLTAWL